jgi:hypothetical protein
MTASFPPSSPQVVDAKETDSGKRLSLAVARLDDLIARLNHLPEMANRPFSSSEKDQPIPHQTLVASVRTPQKNSVG